MTDDAPMSLPMASDTARTEARFITDAAKRVSEQLAFVEVAAQDGQARIRATEHHIKALIRYKAIHQDVGQEILRHLLRPDELK